MRTIGDLQVHEQIMGEGEPLLMLHGWGADSELLLPLANRLAPEGFRCYMPDLPGFGDSAEPPQTWTTFDYAAFVIAYMDAHDLAQVFLFGHSFGGRLGLVLGAEHGARIRKMALSNSAGIVTPAPLHKRLRLSVYKTLRTTLHNIGAATLANQLQRAYTQRYGSADYQQASPIMRGTLSQVVQQDLRAHAARVQAPTLLFWGDQDEATPLWYGQTFEQIMPDAGLIVHEGAGHYSYLEHPAETARVMTYFFRQDQSTTT